MTLYITTLLIPMSKSIILTFGKYKDKSIDEVDDQYLLWLYSQDWIKEKYPQIYNYIKRHKREIEANAWDYPVDEEDGDFSFAFGCWEWWKD